MLSDDLPAVGALLGEQSEEVDVERQPWHFESDDTLVIPPEPGSEPEPRAESREPEPVAAEPEPPSGGARASSRSSNRPRSRRASRRR